MSEGLVIVGGGQAAASAAAKLRELDATVSITMICAEDVLPYQRPPLSKAYLSGEMPLERLILRPQSWFDEQNITVQSGKTATAIDTANHSLHLSDGSALGYSKLLLATGSRERRLPDAIGGSLSGVHYLRSREHADTLGPDLKAGNKVLVVGGGYIGLEVAAIARKLGLSVTVIEMAERILQRVASPQTSDFFRILHTSHGVEILESAGLSKLIEKQGRVAGAKLTDGRVLDADIVLVGIGILPASELAKSADLDIDNGIAVDEFCRSSDRDIFAAGDCASFYHNDQRIRLESVPNAIHQAEIAAQNMLGAKVPYVATPWFWSDQYDVKLQIAGLNTGYEDVVVRPGKREGAQSIWYYDDDKLLAVDALNDAPSFMMARRILEAGKSVPKQVAMDPQTNLKDWV